MEMQNDYLMKQIDEIRDRAKSLQAKLISKEEELSELEIMASEKETEVKQLENRLDVQRKQAGEVVSKAKEEMTAYAVQVEDSVNRLLKEIEDSMETMQEQSAAGSEELKSQQEELNAMLLSLKEDLSDKIHSECIKVYRNLQSGLDDIENLITQKEPSKETIKKMKSPAALWALIFGILNFVMIGGYILYDLGILSQIIGM